MPLKLLKIDDEVKICLALMIPFIILAIQYFILIYLNLIDTSDAFIIQTISKILVAIVYIYAFPAVFRRLGYKIFLLYGFSLFIFFFYYLIFPNNRIYMESISFSLFGMCLPGLIYAISLKRLEVLSDKMLLSSNIIFVFGVSLGILSFLGIVDIGTYSMTLSYSLLFPTIIYLDRMLDKMTFLNVFGLLVSLGTILSFGSRGAVLCVAIFLVLKVLFNNSKITYKRAFFYLSCSILLLISIFKYKEILLNFQSLLNSFGLYSRSLDLFLMSEIHLSGRENIYSNLLSIIADNPLIGVGIAGDRFLLNGAYAHNIFIEIILNYGIIIGFFLIITLICVIWKALFIARAMDSNIILIWISLGLVQLLISSSYLIDIKFWILLGIVLNLVFRTNNDSKVIKYKERDI